MDEHFTTLEKYNVWNGEKFQTGYLRTEYIDRIYSSAGSKLVKVLVGQRRTGKSYILRQMAMRLIESGVDRKNLFFLNKEFTDFDFIRSYKDLENLIRQYREQIKPEGRVYLFIDEIQNIEGWERLINSYSQDYVNDYEIFITGSNSKMLSGELATLLSGRYVCFEIFPFSYLEYVGAKGKDNCRQSYIEYMNEGGMPELFQLPSEEIKRNYISALKDTVLLRDIIQRHNIKDGRLLEDIFVYLTNNVSNLFSIHNLTNYFNSIGRKTSFDTISDYVGYLVESFLLHKAERYDIRGKETISGNCKYYANDLSFNNYLYKGFGRVTGYMLENLVYLELLRYGFNVYVGAAKDKEVDFVAIKGDRTLYVQAAYILSDNATAEREYSALEFIEDSFEKIIVSLDDIALPSRNGIHNIQAWNLASLLSQ